MWYNHPQREVRPVKKIVALLLAVCVILCACGKEPEKIDYGAAILGTWYAVEYESEYVEFLEDGTVVVHVNQAGSFTLVVDPEDEVVDNKEETK